MPNLVALSQTYVGLARRSNLGLGSVAAPLETRPYSTRVSIENLTHVEKRKHGTKHGQYLLKTGPVSRHLMPQMTRIDQPTYDFLLVIHSRPKYGPISYGV